MRSRRPSSSTDDGDPEPASPLDGGDYNYSTSAAISSTTKPDVTTPISKEKMEEPRGYRRVKARSFWACSISTLCVTILSALTMVAIVHSFQSRQCDVKGCIKTYMSPAYAPLVNFDTEHTRFASKYKPRGVPVLFIPGNAGSYKQVRSMAKEGARQWAELVQVNPGIEESGRHKLDFFTVDFNEDITAFHGQTLLDQAEYLNDAVAYILSLYHDARKSTLDSDLPDPSSVIIVGHSMGGIVARTMLTMPNYQLNSVNTIITLSTPHARAPVSFDEQIVSTYTHINDYWRKSYSAEWAPYNPLFYTTLISIAGGSLDTVVPSDYANVASILPETNGFTVFTSSIPDVWVSIDHLAILWCNQLMKVLIGSLLDIVDVKRPGQTKSRPDRMRVFKKWYLTGMEDNAIKTLPQETPSTLLTLEDISQSMIPQGERLVIRELGQSPKPRAYLMPIPATTGTAGARFTLLTNRNLEHVQDDHLKVLLCSMFSSTPSQTAQSFPMNMDLSGDGSGSTKLACKLAGSDVIHLPASTKDSQYPFDQSSPFSYLQYDFGDIYEHQFVAVVDSAATPTTGWAVGEFVYRNAQKMQANTSLTGLLVDGLHVTLASNRHLVQELTIPAIHSSLLTWKLSFQPQSCRNLEPLFQPILRQYISEPYESKYFVNVKNADIHFHGSAPFMPQALKPGPHRGLSLQFWSDPTCNAPVDVTLKFDPWGSLGKLVMRYRTIFAAFPLLMVASVSRKQFREYNSRGRFISFNEGLDIMIAQTLPVTLVVFSTLAAYFAIVNAVPSSPMSQNRRHNRETTKAEYARNDLLIGLQDPFFWFLAPLFALVSLGVVVVVNYLVMVILRILMGYYTILDYVSLLNRDKKRSIAAAFVASSPKRRVMTTLVLLSFVAFVVPYQFAYLVACIVQLATTVRALKCAHDNSAGDRHSAQWNFYHYTHSIMILMLWILPINLPVLVVWIHNLAVHWLTPFSSHHNLISIVPFILLVETLTSGKMIPRVTTRLWLVTDILLAFLAFYAGIWGVTYAYRLHHLVNVVVAWLITVHFSKARLTTSGLLELFNDDEEAGGSKQRPE
ncbi:PGAP1-domain-containing protein [Terfezia boudieri ATCC MYA-4762]|uniref:GPI inositol-deacylase n=1 Tax=Terfezia boudieri ATCC MYA-4762 TaxID=1051890 RepID=A0A3N4M963_9PEZI|nr:PGAP1-domain-containing protein [Terfezia boudieri ATCC MYA-4762]